MGSIKIPYAARKCEQEAPRFFNLKEAAAYWRVSKRVMKKAVEEGRVPCVRLSEQTYRISREVMDEKARSGGKIETVEGKDVK